MDGMAEQLEQALAFIERIGAELLNRRVGDWYPEGAHNAAAAMSEDMRLLAAECVEFDVGPVSQPPQPAGPTVRCRIAVSINAKGEYNAIGTDTLLTNEDLIAEADETIASDGDVVHIIEADVPIPQRVAPQVIQGTVTE